MPVARGKASAMRKAGWLTLSGGARRPARALD
jgi:hypothetical protein